MIDVMPGVDLDQSPQRLLPALGVQACFRKLLRCQRTNQRQVPVAQRGERRERLLSTVCLVGLGPQILVEGLNCVVIKSKRLTIAETERQLTIRQMDHDLSWTPLARSDRLVDSRFAER